MIARACWSASTARRCSYHPIASASSVNEAQRRAKGRVSAGSSSGGSWYWSNPTEPSFQAWGSAGAESVAAPPPMQQGEGGGGRPPPHPRGLVDARPAAGQGDDQG